MVRIVYLLAAFGAVIAAFEAVMDLGRAESAPQQAAAAAMALCWAIIPYCFARALDHGLRADAPAKADLPVYKAGPMADPAIGDTGF